jgi:DNA polymerase-3 subunit alpha
MNMFGAFADDAPAPEEALPDLPEWEESVLLAYEKEVLGFYVTSHPLARHEQVLRHFTTAGAADLVEMRDGAEAILGGMITRTKPVLTKAGKRMVIFDLETLSGQVGCVVFPRDYEKFAPLIQEDAIVFVRGQVDRRREEPGLRTDEVLSIADGQRELTHAVVIRLHEIGLDEGLVANLREVLASHPGPRQVYVELLSRTQGRTLIRAGNGLRVSADAAFRRDVEALLGEDHLLFSANSSGVMARV